MSTIEVYKDKRFGVCARQWSATYISSGLCESLLFRTDSSTSVPGPVLKCGWSCGLDRSLYVYVVEIKSPKVDLTLRFRMGGLVWNLGSDCFSNMRSLQLF